jgi:hypothetical protein
MATEISTVSVHPDRHEALRDVRDENDLPSLDAALGKVLRDAGHANT